MLKQTGFDMLKFDMSKYDNKEDTLLADHPLDIKEMSSFSSSDRRIRARRLDVCFPVQVTHNGNPVHGFAEAINISWSGILLATNFPVAVGDSFTLEFILPTFHIPIQTQARVTRFDPEQYHDQPSIVGLTFMNLETNISRMISGFVLEHLEV